MAHIGRDFAKYSLKTMDGIFENPAHNLGHVLHGIVDNPVYELHRTIRFPKHFVIKYAV